MVRRAALVLLLLVFSGIAAIFAAGHFGLRLPWEIAAPKEPDPASKDREQAAKPGEGEDTTAGEAETAIEETTAALGAAKPGDAAPAPGSVALDISRISPDGLSVFAGRAEPNSYVTVLENGKPAGTVKADAHGEWSLATEHKFASTDPKLTFEVTTTPPPEPAPATAAATPPAAKAADPASPSAAAVASEVMRKFENLVAEARKEAARETSEKKAEAERKAEPKAAPDEAEAKAPEAATAAEPQTPSAGTTVAEAPKDGAPPPLPEVTAPAAPEARASADTAAADAAGSASTDADKRTTTAAASAEADSSDNAASDQSASAAGGDAPIPVPIMFVYNEATLTPEGRRAADLLLEYLTLKRLSAVELTGHADERGTHEYNFELSRERLDAVSDLLKQGGYTGELKLIPKGKTEPYMGVDRSKYHGEALFQLDRRVELRVTR